MRVTFLQNLGFTDANDCNKRFGCSMDANQCRIGETVELDDRAADYLAAKYTKHGRQQSLFETVNVRGTAKNPAVTAPAK